MSIEYPYSPVMKKDEPQTTFELLLLLTCLSRNEDMEALRPWLSFIQKGQWATGQVRRVGCDAFDSHELDALVLDLVSSLEGLGVSKSDRILALILTDWEFMDVAAIEQVLLHLARIYPDLHIEALRPSSRQERTFDLFLIAGDA